MLNLYKASLIKVTPYLFVIVYPTDLIYKASLLWMFYPCFKFTTFFFLREVNLALIYMIRIILLPIKTFITIHFLISPY